MSNTHAQDLRRILGENKFRPVPVRRRAGVQRARPPGFWFFKPG